MSSNSLHLNEPQHQGTEDTKCSIQLARPYLPANAIKYFQSKTISDYSMYKQRMSQVVSFLTSITKTLKFPTRTLETAMVYYQRYYLMNTFSTSTNLDVALTALFIASKNEDTIKKLRDIILVANPLRSVSNTGDQVEETRKNVLHIEKKMLETISFDFRTYHVEEFLVKFCKYLGISFKDAFLSFTMVTDSFQTEIALRVPSHAIAIAAIILTFKFRKDSSIFPLQSDKFYCERKYINEALNDLTELYIHNYNYTSFATMYPNSKEEFINIKLGFKSVTPLEPLDTRIFQVDRYFFPKDYTISDNGSARYMLGTQSKRFYEEVDENDKIVKEKRMKTQSQKTAAGRN